MNPQLSRARWSQVLAASVRLHGWPPPYDKHRQGRQRGIQEGRSSNKSCKDEGVVCHLEKRMQCNARDATQEYRLRGDATEAHADMFRRSGWISRSMRSQEAKGDQRMPRSRQHLPTTANAATIGAACYDLGDRHAEDMVNDIPQEPSQGIHCDPTVVGTSKLACVLRASFSITYT